MGGGAVEVRYGNSEAVGGGGCQSRSLFWEVSVSPVWNRVVIVAIFLKKEDFWFETQHWRWWNMGVAQSDNK